MADLQDIGDLEGYVRATGVMLFFLSKNYFTSRNCLREVKASIDEQRPLVLVHEQQEEMQRMVERAARLRAGARPRAPACVAACSTALSSVSDMVVEKEILLLIVSKNK